MTAGKQFSFQESLQILPHLDSLEIALKTVRRFVLKCGFEELDISNIALVVEEVLVNIISYAKLRQEQAIIMDLFFAENDLEIVFKDPGVAFNVLTNPKNFVPGDPLKLTENGGLGIFFVINLMDILRYKRFEETNVLSLIKHRR